MLVSRQQEDSASVGEYLEKHTLEASLVYSDVYAGKLQIG